MPGFLVHMHTGPDDPTKAALGCLVASKAAESGHETAVFMAGDAVRLLDPDVVASLEGLGTGKLSAHLDALRAHDARFYLSGMSAKARGYDESLLAGYPAEFAMPDTLLSLAAEADTVLCY
jgi:predicted peroxiredoxin